MVRRREESKEEKEERGEREVEKAAAGFLVRERREQVAAKKGTLIHPVILGTAAPGPTEQETNLRVTVSPPAPVCFPCLI